MASHFAGAESGRTPQEGELRRITTAAIVSLSTRSVNRRRGLAVAHQ